MTALNRTRTGHRSRFTPLHALFLLALLLFALPGCEHDTGAEITEATVIYHTDPITGATSLSATVWPREESWSLWGSELSLDPGAEVGLNQNQVAYDHSKYAYYSEIAEFLPGSGFDLTVAFDQQEKYLYHAVVMDLNLRGMADQPKLRIGATVTLVLS